METKSDARGNGWDEWGKHVLKEIGRQDECIIELEKKVQDTQVEIAMLKVKAGVWGLIAGLIPSVFALIYIYLKSTK
jgi:hypothetical protein